MSDGTVDEHDEEEVSDGTTGVHAWAAGYSSAVRNAIGLGRSPLSEMLANPPWAQSLTARMTQPLSDIAAGFTAKHMFPSLMQPAAGMAPELLSGAAASAALADKFSARGVTKDMDNLVQGILGVQKMSALTDGIAGAPAMTRLEASNWATKAITRPVGSPDSEWPGRFARLAATESVGASHLVDAYGKFVASNAHSTIAASMTAAQVGVLESLKVGVASSWADTAKIRMPGIEFSLPTAEGLGKLHEILIAGTYDHKLFEAFEKDLAAEDELDGAIDDVVTEVQELTPFEISPADARRIVILYVQLLVMTALLTFIYKGYNDELGPSGSVISNLLSAFGSSLLVRGPTGQAFDMVADRFASGAEPDTSGGVRDATPAP